MRYPGTFAVILSLTGLLAGQVATQSVPVVPQLLNYSGNATDVHGNPITGIAGITFCIYKDQNVGAPLWMETQNVGADANGNYTVQLGATKSDGLPLELFTTGEARWLGLRVNGGEEQPRVMLLSVPYALKAADAQTLAGFPASAFVLAAPPSGGGTLSGTALDSASATIGTLQPAVSGSGSTDYIPLWTPNGTTLGSSVLYQTGSGSTAKVGLNTINPTSTLDVKGGVTVRGMLSLPATGTATASAGTNSQPEKLTTSSYNSSTSVAVNQSFQWQAEPSGNDTASPSGTLNLLFGSGSATPSETGLKIASNGRIAFAPGQTFTGTTVNANVYDLGGKAFAFGSSSNFSAFLGFAGNSASTGQSNTGVGYEALHSNTTGSPNAATGAYALFSNTTGGYNTADGYEALYFNTSGNANTAMGNGALLFNSTGSYNTAVGYGALNDNSTGTNNTAMGYSALSSNAASDNTGIGYGTLHSNTTGHQNTGTGSGVLDVNSTGYDETAMGYQALHLNETGFGNTAVGSQALSVNTGVENTAVGSLALSSNQTGNDLTCVGYACTVSGATLSNATAIGAHAIVSQSNALVLGGTGTYGVTVGIGTSNPSNVLTIGRGAGHPVSDSWETYSSRRWKTNIKTLPDALSKVERLRGVSYDLSDSGKHEIGVIAEEVGQVVPEVVSYEANGKDASGVDYSRLTALLIEAVKQQQKQIVAQQRLAKAHQHEILRLSRKLGMLESNLHTGHTVKASVLSSRVKTDSAALPQ